MTYKSYTLGFEQSGVIVPGQGAGTLKIDEQAGKAVIDFGSESLALLLAAPSIALTDFINPPAYDPGRAALAVLRVASDVQDGETVTITPDVYEVDTEDVPHVTSGRIPLDLHGGSTVKAQGTITMAVKPTANQVVVIGASTYKFVASPSVAGDVAIGSVAADSQANLIAAIAGDAHNTVNASATAAAFSGNASVVTAIKGGTVGNAITFTSTLTATDGVDGAGTLGTTTAGVDPTGAEFTTALAAAINASGTANVTAIRVSATEVLVHTSAAPGGAIAASAAVTVLAETLAGTNNAWDTSALRGGLAAGVRKIEIQSRVPNSAEVVHDHMHFLFPFTPAFVRVFVAVTATPGLAVAWNGGVTIDGGHVTIDNGSSTDWTTSHTLTVIATD